jgi:outer membrane protein OmpU
MKKLLLGSTALVAGGLMAAPAMAADPIKIGVGGYYTFYAMAGSIDSVYALNGSSAQFRGVSFIQEGELHFIGQTKLDSGTTVGLTVELEAHNVSAGAVGAVNQVDEAFLFAFGDWGRIEMGGRDSGAYRMYYGTPSALIGWGFFQHNHQYAWAGAGTGGGANKAYRGGIATTINPQMQDVNRINYFTPRFAGFQVGLSYTPKVNAGAASGSAGAGGVCGAQVNNGPACPTNDYSYQDGIDIGVNYLNKFGDFTVAAYGAFMYYHFVPGFAPNPAAANTATGANLTSWKQYVAGVQFGFAGFTIGGAIGWDNNGLGTNYFTHVDNDTRFYTAGVMYETGPWQLSAGWAGFRNTNGNGSLPLIAVSSVGGATAGAPATSALAFGGNPNAGALSFGAETVDKFEVGANYALAPGVKLVGGFMYYNISGPSALVNGNSWVALLGMDFRF